MFHKLKKYDSFQIVLVSHITDYELCLSKLASKKILCPTDWKISRAKEGQMPRKLGSDALQRYRYKISFFGNQIYAILG